MKLKGSLTKQKSGHYRGRVDVPTYSGKRKQLSKTFKTNDDKTAQKMFKKWLLEVETNNEKYLHEDKSLSFVVEQWLKKLESRVDIGNIKKSTYYSYYYPIKNILNYFPNNMLASSLNEETLQDLILYLHTEKALAPVYTKYHLSSLKKAFDFGLKKNFINHNPLRSCWDDLDFPDLSKERPRFLNMEEIELILEKATNYFIIEKIIRFAIHTGIRRAEIPALKWENIYEHEGYIDVKGQLEDSTHDIVPPKSKYSFRAVPITKLVSEVLLEIRAWQNSLLRQGIDLSEGFIFTNVLGKPIRPAYISDTFKKIVGMAGVKKDITFHCTRHTFASNMIISGVHITTVSEILGHFDPSFTYKTYVHSNNELKKEAAFKYENFWQERSDLKAAPSEAISQK